MYQVHRLHCLAFLLLFAPVCLFGQDIQEDSYYADQQASELFGKGLPYLNAGKNDSAIYCFSASIDQYHKAKNREGVFSSGIYLAIALKQEGRLTELLQKESMLNAYIHKSDSLNTLIRLSLGAAYFEKGDYQSALQSLRKSEHSFEDMNSTNIDLKKRIWENQAKIYRTLSCYRAELDRLGKIRELANSSDSSFLSLEDKISLRVYEAMAYARTYHQAECVGSLNSAIKHLAPLNKSEKSDVYLWALEQIGKTYLQIGELGLAEQYLEKFKRSLPKEDPRIPHSLFNLGKLAFLNQNFEQSLQLVAGFLESSLDQEQLFEKEAIEEATYLAGEIYRLSGQYDLAFEKYQQLFTLWGFQDEVNKSIFRIPSINKLPPKVSVFNTLWSYAMCLAENYQNTSQQDLRLLESSLATYQQAMLFGDQLRENPLLEEPELIPLDSLNIRYEQAIAVAIDLYHQKEDERFLGIAFQFQQRKKAEETKEIFLQYFRRYGPYWGKEKQILRRDFIYRILKKEKELSLAKNEEAQTLLTSIINNLNQAYESWMEDLQQSASPYFTLYQKKAYSDLDVLRNKLKAHEVLISYFMGKDRLYVFELRQSGIRFHEVAKQNISTEMITSFLHEIQTKSIHPETYSRQAHNLYQSLLAPSLSDSTSSLIIIPDHLLHYVPFEALVYQDSLNDSFSDLDYIIKKFPIRYLNHSSDLLKMHRRYFQEKKKLASFFPSYKSLESISWLDSLQLNLYQTQNMTSRFFPNIENQGSAIEKRLEKLKGYPYTGKKASETRFKSIADNFYTLEMNGYALSSDLSPAYSGLAFSNVQEGPHFLHNHEIFRSRFPNDLIVLANHTTIGEIHNGLGKKSLVSSFQLARASNMVIALWLIPESSHQSLLSDFYKSLFIGKGKADALREAKLTYLKHEANPHPFYWSNMVLYGDNVQLEGEERPWWSYGALVFALLIVLIVLIGLRRRRR